MARSRIPALFALLVVVVADRVQAIFYDEVPRVKVGDCFSFAARRKELRGFQSTPRLYFWNCWLAT